MRRRLDARLGTRLLLLLVVVEEPPEEEQRVSRRETQVGVWMISTLSSSNNALSKLQV